MDWLKLGKEYAEAVYCHSAYLTSKQRTSHEMRGWINHKLESRLPGEITTTSDMQMIPLLDCKEIKQVNPKGNQPWIFIRRTDDETEVPILWPPDVKSQLSRKDPDAGKDWRQEKGMTEEEMVGWHHLLDVHKFEQASGDGEGQRRLVCCSSWGWKESDMTERLNYNNNKNLNRHFSREDITNGQQV